MSKNYNQTLQTNNSSLEEIITQLNNMPDAGGLDTSDATATSGDILSGKTAYVQGSKVTGNIATKTSSNLTANGATVTVPAGYYSTQATKTVATATQATPTITINSSTGLITATATQTAGYVAAGTKSGTKQLAFQAAQTITPGTVDQTIAANTYLGGIQTIKGDANLVASNIVSGKSIFGVIGTATAGGSDPFENAAPFTYTVSSISGASYGFALNTNGYYESQNKGQHGTYAICRVNLTVKTACDITFDVINYAEGSYDYALFGNLDAVLNLNNSADTSNVKKNFKGLQSANVVNVIYENVSTGNHTIDIKFIKDGSQNSNNDSVQFKIQEQGGLSQETIDKILAADTDLVAENIKSGVDIFGVVGNYTGGGGGDTSAEDGLVTGLSLTAYTNDRVTRIRDYAFYSIKTLTTAIFPACTSIGGNAFYSCTKLASISFPKCTAIGSNAFYNCSALTVADFPLCTSIGSSAFYSCSKLTTANFPMCTTIYGSAFSYCRDLKTINFPACTSIHSDAFHNCWDLTNVSFAKCTYIGSGAFGSCTGLVSAIFPVCANVPSRAFANCGLTYISLPVCTTIGYYAFTSCRSLPSIDLPVCKTIGSAAFDRCTSLSAIYLRASTVCKLSHSNAFSSTGIWSDKGSIFVPASLLASYKAATNWAFFAARIFSMPSSGDSGGNGGHAGGEGA